MRLQRRWLLLPTLLLPLLLLGLLWARVKTLESARWKEMELRVAALRRRSADDRQSRGPVRSEVDTGDSWQEYAAAMVPLTDAKAFQLLHARFEGNSIPIPGYPVEPMPVLPPLTPELALAALAPYSENLRHFRNATRRVPGERPSQLRFDRSSSFNFYLAANFLTSLAVWESRRLRQTGHSDEASEMLVDIMIVCGDRSRGEGRSEINLAERDWERSQTELRNLLLTDSMSKSALASLLHDLLALDGTLYSHAAYLRRALPRIGDQILRDGAYHESYEDGSRDVEPVPGQDSWKYGFSSRLTCATAYLWIDSWVARLSDVDRLPWKEVVELRRECGEFVDSTGNPVAMKFFMRFEPETVRQRRTIEARNRLLLALTAYLLTGSVPETPDPYGNNLRSTVKDGIVRIWSLGMDGEDQGGEGSWEKPYQKDLPVEFRRQR